MSIQSVELFEYRQNWRINGIHLIGFNLCKTTKIAYFLIISFVWNGIIATVSPQYPLETDGMFHAPGALFMLKIKENGEDTTSFET